MESSGGAEKLKKKKIHIHVQGKRRKRMLKEMIHSIVMQ